MFESDGAVRVVDEKKLGKKIREFFFCLWYFAANLDPACQHLGGGRGGLGPLVWEIDTEQTVIM
jgi:hypothetical protein